MMTKLTSKTVIFGITLLTLIFLITELQARRFGGGGGGMSRGGIASGGGFSGARAGTRTTTRSHVNRTSRTNTREVHREPRVNRQQERERSENLNDRQDDRQDFVRERQEDRQDFVEDELDDRWDRCCHDGDGRFIAGAVVGGAIGAAASNNTYIVTLPCSTAGVVYNGNYYYDCSGTWYQKSYVSGDVVYIVTSAPPVN